MTGSRKAENRLKLMMSFPYMHKVAKLINSLMSAALHLRVVSTRDSVIDKNWVDQFLYFQRLFDLIKSVEGDVVECGVASGHSLAMLANLVKSSGINRHIWGFDSWQGLPPPSNEDLASTEAVADKGIFKGSSIETVLSSLSFWGIDDSEISNTVTLVKGLFSETLPKYGDSKIALLYADVDLYDSYKVVLRHLWSKVSINGIIAFDEYDLPDKWPGARKAIDEFLGGLPPASVRLKRDTLYGKYYAIKTA